MAGHEINRRDGSRKDVNQFGGGHRLDKRLPEKRDVHRHQNRHVTAALTRWYTAQIRDKRRVCFGNDVRGLAAVITLRWSAVTN